MSTYDLPNNILEFYYKKEVKMKEKIINVLKQYGEMEANLNSEALRDKLADDIIEIVEKSS
tara:strand:- start:321 stop:503 length:183 start_codon:yes stop_codon:yes gene_type:complete